MELLGKIFGGVSRVKIIRLFLLNPQQTFASSDILARTKASRIAFRKDVAMLEAIGFIKKRIRGGISKKVPQKGKRAKVVTSKKVIDWGLNPQFQFLDQFRQLFIDPILLAESVQVSRFRPVGKLRLVVASGVFIGDTKSKADLLIVADSVKKKPLDIAIKTIESEIGKELSYAVFTTEDYIYRMSMFDRLVCDFTELPHLEIFKNMEFSTYRSKNI